MLICLECYEEFLGKTNDPMIKTKNKCENCFDTDVECVIILKDWVLNKIKMDNSTYSSRKLKKCSICEKERPINMFYKDMKTNDGHTSICKRCRKNKR